MLTTQLIIARAAHIAASILLAGIFTFEVVLISPADQSRRRGLQEIERCLFRLTVWSLIGALLSALLWFWLEVASMTQLSLKDALSTTAWWTVLFETQFGRVWQLRLGLIAAAFVLVASGLAKTAGEPLTNRAVNFKVPAKDHVCGRQGLHATGASYGHLRASCRIQSGLQDGDAPASQRSPILDPTARGGPELEFQIYPLQPGFVRLFAQVQIDGRSHFAPFGLQILP